MRKSPRFWGLHADPSPGMRLALGAVPVILLICAYLAVSHVRQTANPSDKLTPPVSLMAAAFWEMAFVQDPRTGQYPLATDTAASLRRIVTGLGGAAVAGLFIGLNTGLQPGFRAAFQPMITVLSIVPPLSILPVLLILFGVGETGKIALIFIGALFLIARDAHQAVERIPREQVMKALTLGASQFQVMYRVILPQIMPRLLITVRICLGGAWLFLIASEAVAATEGLGYRIFLMRRYLAMDVIIPYVLWITLLGFGMDSLLRMIVKWRYPWYSASQ